MIRRFVALLRKAVSKVIRLPNPELQALARDYNRRYVPENQEYGPGDVDEGRARQIADAYEAMPHDPENPEVKATYDALKKETLAQWHHLTKNGYTMEPWTEEGEPYHDSAEMMEDLRANRHMHFFPTEQGFGSGETTTSDHPLLQPTPLVVNGHRLLYNDLFRAVHDAFGHAAEGHQFGPKGEENAWRTHAAMYSPAARPALTSETRGQNSWVNFGPHLRRADGTLPKKGDPDWIHPAERPFAEQKAGLLPPAYWEPGPS